jgi:CIC family chloride channel protein
MSIKDALSSIRKQKSLGDAFNEGVDYTKKFRQLKDDVEEGREWSLGIRLTGIFVSLTVGAFVGLVALTLLYAVDFFNSLWKPNLITDFSQIQFIWNPILGICLLVSALFAGQILLRIKDGRPRGPADLILAAQRNEPPEIKNGFLSATLAMVSLSGGSSVGMFGPLMHFGGCFSYIVKKHLKLATKLPLEVVLGSGAAAAIAAVFSAPIGAAIFAHEAIIRRFGSFGAGPVIASAFGAYWAAILLRGEYKLFNIATNPDLNLNSMFIAIGVGLASAIVAIAYINTITSSSKLVKIIRVPLAYRPLIPALLLFLISPIFPHLLGHGIWSVDIALAGQFTLSFLLSLIFLKIIITGFCIGFGFFGGVFAPALFLGTLVGASVDLMLVSTSYAGSSFAILGAASCIAAVIGAPLAAVVIVFELTGSYDWAVLAMVSVVSSQQFTRAFAGRSLFDRQLFLRGIKLTDDHK